MANKICQCCIKIKDLESKMTQIIEYLKIIPKYNEQHKLEHKSKSFIPDDLTDTLLLDFSQTQKERYTFGSINDNISKLTLRINELEAKSSIVANLKENLGKQTAVIYFLQKSIQDLLKNQRRQTTISKQPSKKCSQIKKDYYSPIFSMKRAQFD